ncbi:hypothetical protein [Shimazuella alba]|uniref:Uncharacterized protein n=1 Tax=Shimazuella alba TaxID=2690964 RepID=A0A6I4VSY4_9BACL|nr:hypothetical protein [Shimazuella alba]MXQ53551.1 hypothetical protein [Shimazuella alba]
MANAKDRVKSSLLSVKESIRREYRRLGKIVPPQITDKAITDAFTDAVRNGIPIYNRDGVSLNPKHPASSEYWETKRKDM